MKRLIPISLILLLFFGCSPRLHVSSDYDKAIDFNTYKTFAWAKEQESPDKGNPMFDNELNRNRIKESIEEELGVLGFLRMDLAPDLLIDFHITIDQKTDYKVHDNYSFGFIYWPDYNASTYSYKKGALVIHFVDRKKEQLVWQGVGSSILADIPPENPEEKIQRAVRAILAQYATIKK
ncbi:MAG: hypothetical protein ACI82Q_000915 [Nonlabens sp.]|jgi:hypothetical protein